MQATRIATIAASAAAALFAAGCTTTAPSASSTNTTARAALDRSADAALSRLYSTAAGSQAHVRASRAQLICPDVVGGSFGIGVETGRCVLREAGRPNAYYRTTALSAGFQAGAASRALFYVFSNQAAVDSFRNSNGFSLGAEADVSLATMGANASVDTNTVNKPVSAYVLTNAGLQAGVSLQGNKFSKLDM